MVRVYRHVQSLPHRFFSGERTGNLIARSINDIEAVEDFIAHGVPETILAIVFLSLSLSIFNSEFTMSDPYNLPPFQQR
jgi:ABC-type bacteriocin/lantibiotic exporter with double-glycine peptidase domain